jgi:hypothetical protein
MIRQRRDPSPSNINRISSHSDDNDNEYISNIETPPPTPSPLYYKRQNQTSDMMNSMEIDAIETGSDMLVLDHQNESENSNSQRKYQISLLIVSITVIIIIMNVYNIPFSSLLSLSTFSTLISNTYHSHNNINNLNCPTGVDLLGQYGVIDKKFGRKISSNEQITQDLFNQGLFLMYGFNGIEAKRNFEAAIQYDPNCAICYWAITYLSAPTLNEEMKEKNYLQGKIALSKAIELINNKYNIISNLKTSSENEKILIQIEKDLIYTQSDRFANTYEDMIKNGQSSFDKKYSTSMLELIMKYPQDTDISAQCAESIMNLSPWNYYEDDEVTIIPSILPAYNIIKDILVNHPTHPLALHLFIHITEPSKYNANEGLVAADTLMNGGIAKGSNHLQHMPSHIYNRIGLYDKSINSSLIAIKDDEMYIKKCLTPYAALHNRALLIFSALSSGRMGIALKYSTESVLEMEYKSALYVSSLFPTPKELIWARFGKWDKILSHQKKENGKNLKLTSSLNDNVFPPYIQMLRLYAQSLSLIGIYHQQKHHSRLPLIVTSNNILDTINKLSLSISKIPASEMNSEHIFYPFHEEIGIIVNNTVYAALAVSNEDYQLSSSLLLNAANVQKKFKYMEPEHHYLPMALCYATSLEKQSQSTNDVKLKEYYIIKSMEVYLDDLIEHPLNPWAYKGITNSISILKTKLNKSNTYINELLLNSKPLITTSNIEILFDKSWELADKNININGSCCEINLC